MYRLFYLLLPIMLVVSACDPSNNVEDNNPAVNFDRQEMLAGWVDNVITPAYSDFEIALQNLSTAVNGFSDDPSETNQVALEEAFRDAYISYQALDPVLIGRAEEIRMRDQLNTYPTDQELITTNARSGAANLELPSNTAAQGFPAIDYLLFGLEAGALTNGPDATAYRSYLSTLVNRIQDLTATSASFWTAEERQAYIENDGNSATASIDRTVNDFIFYYEKFLRAGKVGIPAGIFSDDPLADRAEALYGGFSPELFAAALNASQDFFENHGLADYLDAVGVQRNGENLSSQIINQFNAAREKAATISLPFAEQVATDNVQMLELYNELQGNVILLKVDMLQALSISVDYVDADGD